MRLDNACHDAERAQHRPAPLVEGTLALVHGGHGSLHPAPPRVHAFACADACTRAVCRAPAALQLDCCSPLDIVKQRGIDMDTFVCLATCNAATAEAVRAPPVDTPATAAVGGATAATPCASPSCAHVCGARPVVQASPTSDATEEAFREAVLTASQRADGEFLILSYSRKAVGQTGDGHFSPMGGYHKASDMLLVLDTARFKYAPHWVPVSRMWTAMRAIDKETGLPRGYIRVSRRAAAPLLLFQLTPASPTNADKPRTGDMLTGIGTGAPGDNACLNQRLRAAVERAFHSCSVAILTSDAHSVGAVGALAAPAPGTDLLPGPVADMIRTFVHHFEQSSHGSTVRMAMPLSVLEDERCIDKLSREHIRVASTLLSELQSTPTYAAVEQALRWNSGSEGADVVIPLPPPSAEAAAAGEAPADAVRSGSVSESGSPMSASSGHGPSCSTCGISCIRVRKAHVLTVRTVRAAAAPCCCRMSHAPRACHTARALAALTLQLLLLSWAQTTPIIRAAEHVSSSKTWTATAEGARRARLLNAYVDDTLRTSSTLLRQEVNQTGAQLAASHSTLLQALEAATPVPLPSSV
ncbi:hypothetical protein EON66_01365 [archaeon]|nr:MAG: hypothetical protein EON66_01365 [archaeon]